LDEIRRQFSGHSIVVRITGELPALKGVEQVERQNGALRLNLSPEISPQDVLRELIARDVSVEQFEIATPRLDEIFIKVVEK
jgi:ABC-2 type transport system ATP-binding protein